MDISYRRAGYEKFLPPPPIEKIAEIFTEIFRQMADDWELSLGLALFKGSVFFRITDAEKNILFLFADDLPSATLTENDSGADVTILITYEDFHLYWCHKLDLLKAVTSKNIKINGAFNRLLQLNDLVSEARKIYLKLYQ